MGRFFSVYLIVLGFMMTGCHAVIQNYVGTRAFSPSMSDSLAPSVTLSDTPTNLGSNVTLDVDVIGTNVTHYKYKVGIGAICSDSSSYSAEISISTAITDTLGADGTYTICVVGRNAAGT